MPNLEQKKKDHHYGVKNNNYGSKHLEMSIKDIDTRSRTVSGYLAAFDSIDSDFDIIRKGAFAKSLLENGVGTTTNRKIQNLRNHDWDWQIGRYTELKEDDYGLFYVASMGRSTKGNDAFLDYQDGIILEHSIGFNYIWDKLEWVEDIRQEGGGYYNVAEVKLWEGSAVTFGANSLTPVIDVSKGENKQNITLKRLKELTENLVSVVKNGSGTDDRLINLEMQLKQVQQLTNSLENHKPSTKGTSDTEPKESMWNHLYHQI